MTTMPVTIHDVAGDEDKYTLDVHGFQFVKHESKEKEFLDVEKIKTDYYAETEQLVKDITGCSRTYVFNHAVRRAPVETFNGSVPGRGPAFNVHLDQTERAGPARVRRYFPEEADELLKKRYQIINVRVNPEFWEAEFILIVSRRYGVPSRRSTRTPSPSLTPAP
jgi:hypothetical protein